MSTVIKRIQAYDDDDDNDDDEIDFYAEWLTF